LWQHQSGGFIGD